MIRKILALVLGLVSGSVVNMALIHCSHFFYPFPDGVDPNNFDALRAHFTANGIPTGELLFVLVAHAGGSLASGLVCRLVAKRSWYSAAVALGVLWTGSGIVMLTMLPAPIWFAIADTVLYVPAAVLGMRLGGVGRGGVGRGGVGRGGVGRGGVGRGTEPVAS